MGSGFRWVKMGKPGDAIHTGNQYTEDRARVDENPGLGDRGRVDEIHG